MPHETVTSDKKFPRGRDLYFAASLATLFKGSRSYPPACKQRSSHAAFKAALRSLFPLQLSWNDLSVLEHGCSCSCLRRFRMIQVAPRTGGSLRAKLGCGKPAARGGESPCQP